MQYKASNIESAAYVHIHINCSYDSFLLISFIYMLCKCFFINFKSALLVIHDEKNMFKSVLKIIFNPFCNIIYSVLMCTFCAFCTRRAHGYIPFGFGIVLSSFVLADAITFYSLLCVKLFFLIFFIHTNIPAWCVSITEFQHNIEYSSRFDSKLPRSHTIIIITDRVVRLFACVCANLETLWL